MHMSKESKLLRKCKKVGWVEEGCVRVDMKKELKLLLKLPKKVEGGRVQGCGGDQSGCERRIGVIVKMQKKKKKKGWGGVLCGGGVEELKLL